MTDRRYSLTELQRMSHKELAAVGKALGVKVTKNVNKTEARKRIMAAYAKSDVDLAEKGLTDPDTGKISASNGGFAGESAESMPRNPEFERLVAGDEPDPVEHRGGAREGAGRPAGMTDSKARLANRPQQPHPAILAGVTWLFEAWAAAAKCKEIALTKDEAVDLALPYTQLAHYYHLTDRLPESLELWIVAIWNTYNVAKVKLTIIREVQHARTNETETSTDTGGAVGATG